MQFHYANCGSVLDLNGALETFPSVCEHEIKVVLLGQLDFIRINCGKWECIENCHSQVTACKLCTVYQHAEQSAGAFWACQNILRDQLTNEQILYVIRDFEWY